MIRAVVDTNVFVSALVFGGLPLQFISLVSSEDLRLLTSVVLLDELEGILLGKFKRSAAYVAQTRKNLEQLCEVINPLDHLRIILRDPDDDRVLECALAGRADYIVTGDRHLLDLRIYNGTRILTVRQIMDVLLPTV